MSKKLISILLASVMAFSAVACSDDDNSGNGKNDESTNTKNDEPIMARPCDGVQWDNKCYGNHYYKCESNSFVKTECSMVGTCIQFEGDEPSCGKTSDLSECSESTGTVTKCEAFSQWTSDPVIRTYECKKNLADEKYYLLEGDAKKCLDKKCTSESTCYTIDDLKNETENHLKCHSNNTSYCTKKSDHYIIYICNNDEPYLDKECTNTDYPYCIEGGCSFMPCSNNNECGEGQVCGESGSCEDPKS